MLTPYTIPACCQEAQGHGVWGDEDPGGGQGAPPSKVRNAWSDWSMKRMEKVLSPGITLGSLLGLLEMALHVLGMVLDLLQMVLELLEDGCRFTWDGFGCTWDGFGCTWVSFTWVTWDAFTWDLSYLRLKTWDSFTWEDWYHGYFRRIVYAFVYAFYMQFICILDAFFMQFPKLHVLLFPLHASFTKLHVICKCAFKMHINCI